MQGLGGNLARLALAFGLLAALSGCARLGISASPDTVEGYEAQQDGSYTLPAVDPQYLEGVNRRARVAYDGPEAPGTIVVDPYAKFLYLLYEGGQAMRYPVAVGREGRGFSGGATVLRKREWPGWQPTANMLRTEPEVYGPFARGVPGGLASPLGARALYLYRGGRDTYFRIHGTNDMASIGNATSAGCIRLFNQDIVNLYEQVPLGTPVVVRTYEQSVALEGEALANRGRELPPVIVPPEVIYGAAGAGGG